jgi:prepilin-type N-terminal cleavage/methylation domain-containing protein
MNQKLIKNLKFKLKNYQKGFTLIELIIFMGIFSILIMVLFQLLTSIIDVQTESQTTAYVSQDGRYILNKFTYDLRNATSIVSPNIGNQAQTLVISDGVATYTYNLSNGDLIFTNSALNFTDQLNSANTTVSNLNFLRLADTQGKENTITISFTLNSKTVKRSGADSESFRTTIGTR